MHFPWKEEYEMGISVIDKQHKYFVSLINELYDAILSGQTDKKLKEVLDKLIEYAKEHFDTEERYFDKFHYEGADEHKTKHKELKKSVLDFQKRLKEDKVIVSFNLVNFLEDWLSEHLKDMDFKYKDCFKQNGL